MRTFFTFDEGTGESAGIRSALERETNGALRSVGGLEACEPPRVGGVSREVKLGACGRRNGLDMASDQLRCAMVAYVERSR